MIDQSHGDGHGTARSAAEMINQCFRHQHPEAYGRDAVAEPSVPAVLRYGSDPRLPGGEEIPEPPMGHPEAAVLSR